MDKKKCIQCNIEKDLSEYWQYNKRNGEKAYRNVCKDCTRDKDRNRPKRQRRPMEKKYKNPEQSSKFEQFSYLTHEEKEKLDYILENFEQIKSLINCKIEVSNINKSEREPRTLNLEKDLYKLLVGKSASKNMSVSDLANILFREGLSKV